MQLCAWLSGCGRGMRTNCRGLVGGNQVDKLSETECFAGAFCLGLLVPQDDGVQTLQTKQPNRTSGGFPRVTTLVTTERWKPPTSWETIREITSVTARPLTPARTDSFHIVSYGRINNQGPALSKTEEAVAALNIAYSDA